VVKLRSVAFRGGFHDFTIEKGGLRVYPRLTAGQHRASAEQGVIGSGIAEIDALVGGGLERGSATMIMGPAGVGKSSLALQFATSAAAAGQRVAFLPEQHFLTLQLHELLSYLTDAAITTILIVSQHGAIGHVSSPVDVSYLADAVILLRYYETRGSFRRAISMLKKRTSAHEQTVRDYQITSQGVRVGAVLEEFRGILSGMQSSETSHVKPEPAP
jgi:KaiC/GvpD/RAD55 family RecA-like ATPase